MFEPLWGIKSPEELIAAVDLNEFQTKFDGRDQGFLSFIQDPGNHELYSIVKSNTYELTQIHTEMVKDAALLSLKLQYDAIKKVREIDDLKQYLS